MEDYDNHDSLAKTDLLDEYLKSLALVKNTQKQQQIEEYASLINTDEQSNRAEFFSFMNVEDRQKILTDLRQYEIDKKTHSEIKPPVSAEAYYLEKLGYLRHENGHYYIEKEITPPPLEFTSLEEYKENLLESLYLDMEFAILCTKFNMSSDQLQENQQKWKYLTLEKKTC